MKLLFLCARNHLRSPTAEVIFAGVDGVETRSAGVNPDAEQVVSGDDVEWADIILVMEPAQRKKLNRAFGKLLRDKKVVCLAIPDEFDYMEPALIELLWERVPPIVPALFDAKPR
jgi:predicted protein tyrosine phosphatase